MSEERQRVKEEDRRARKKFILWMLAFAALGAAGGLLVGYLKDLILVENLSDIQLFRLITGMLSPSITYVIGTVDLIGLVWLFYRWKQHNAVVSKWDKENEAVVDQTEDQMGCDIWLVSLLQIVNLITFGIEAYCLKNSTMALSVFLIALAIFAVFMGFGIFIQSKLVNLIKIMNPEKRGSTYDMSFRSKWENSCDEAERSRIYQGAYGAFKAINVACSIITVVLIILGLYFEIGLLPVIITGILWITLISAYYIEIRRLEKIVVSKSEE